MKPNFQIRIKPQEIVCRGEWTSKIQGVILVQKEEDIEPLWKLLCEQDDYWESYKDLIKVAPEEVGGYGDLDQYCDYVGKTDIYNIDEIKDQIPFIIYQFREEDS